MLSNRKPKVLAVDDEEFNLDIINEHLTRSGFDVICARDGEKAIEKITAFPDLDVIVLDRMMPKLGGMDVVKALKKSSKHKHIPIVMQTAAAQASQVVEGIMAGVYYYLTKPYKGSLLVAIVKAAIEDGFRLKEIERELKNSTTVSRLIDKCEFEFRTLAEAKSLAFFLSNSFPNSSMAALGLTELMVNAVEHGNLGITYSEKTKHVIDGTLYDEINRRLMLDENKNKKATLVFESVGPQLKVSIKDQGNGFNWKNYLEISPERVTDPNGRGIATSKPCFSSIEYLGNGNEVLCTVNLK